MPVVTDLDLRSTMFMMTGLCL